MAEYNSINEKGQCIFCEIAKGNLEPIGGAVIYSDEDYLAWLSPFPNTEGFTVVIPRKHFGSDVLAMPDSDLNKFVLSAKKVGLMLQNYFKDVGRVGLIMEGTGVDHAHIKLVPMHGTEKLKSGSWEQCHSTNNQYFEKYEGYIASNDGPKTDFDKLKILAKNICDSAK